jgi:hypothetical protein
MSVKGKDKVDDTVFIISDNEGERALTSATTTTVVELKKDTLIKVRESAVFTRDRTKFTAYKISVGLAVWTNNKKKTPQQDHEDYIRVDSLDSFLPSGRYI